MDGKIYFTVLYHSPAFNHSSPESDTFLSNFRNLYSKIKAENLYATLFTGNFNRQSQFWWPDGETYLEGSEIDDHVDPEKKS